MKKDTKSLIKLVKYYKKYSFLCILVVIFSFFYAGISLLSPIYEGKMLANFENFDKNKIIQIALVLLLIRVVVEIVVKIWSRVVLKLNGKINFDLKKDMLDSLTNFETKNFDNTNSGLFVSRLNKDTAELAELFDYITDDLSGVILNVSFIVYVMFINVYLGVFLILNIIITYFFVSKKLYYYKDIKRVYKEKDENLVGYYTDLVRGIREVKNLNLKSKFLKDISVKQRGVIKAEIKSVDTRRTWDRIIACYHHIMDFIFILLSIYFILNNKLSTSAFLIIFLYKNKVLLLINDLSEIREKLADGKISALRVFDIINYNTFSKENYGKKKLENIIGEIKFNDVGFSYGKTQLFNNLNLEIKPNKLIAIVGKSGEGKSTILKLINKSYEITNGKILIDNVDMKELNESSIKNNISIVSQTPYIFNLSIKDNIRLAKPDATDEDIIKVCKEAQIHDDIITMKDKYNTMVGENGVILSGGQKQRIAIARTLMKGSKIILFDEATSSLDNQNQEKIKNVIKKLSYNHTIIIVAHRLSTIVDADEILVLDKHNIVAIGTHEKLIKECNQYKELYLIENSK